MAANVYMKSVVLNQAGQWFKLAASETVLETTIVTAGLGMVPSDAYLFIRYRGGTPVEWPVGKGVRLEGVDLSELEVGHGNANVRVSVIGHTR